MSRIRAALAWVLGLAGLVAYNWWVLVPLKPGLMTSPNELFSDLEVDGRPYAALLQHCDVAAGLLLIAAFLLAGYGPAARAVQRPGRGEWLAMLSWAAAGALGGLYPEVCADGISAVCRRIQWRFQLPASQYVHMAAGTLEFAFITAALFLAVRRNRGVHSRIARTYRLLAIGAVIGYPLLGASYLFDRLGGVMEGVFFVGFTVMAVAQLAERTSALRAPYLPGRDRRDSGTANRARSPV